MLIKILFVCQGNNCRSSLADGLFRFKVMRAGLSEHIESRAVGLAPAAHHKTLHPQVQTYLNELGLAYNLTLASLNQDDFYLYDYILVMDKTNLTAIRQMRPNDATCVIGLLRDYAQLQHEIADPCQTGEFQHVYDQIDASTTHLLKLLVSQYNLQLTL